MNEIQKLRLEVLEEATRRMKQSDYQDMPFADNNELVRLLRYEAQLRKELKSGKILNCIEDKYELIQAKEYNRIIEFDNNQIKDQMKPVSKKIKVLELELMLFNGLFEIQDVSEDIHKIVYPNKEED